jgi:hypothetical protein
MDYDFSHLHVEFFTDTTHNVRRSAEEGRPIYDDVENVRIRIAGDPKSVLVAPANSASSMRDPMTNERLTYAQLHRGPYEAFKRNEDYRGSGTPLSEITFLTASKRKELASFNIHTVEALAGLDGANLARLGMGGRELKTQAEAWLSKAAGSADITKLAAENETLRARLDAMEAMMNGGTKSEPITGPENSAGISPFDDWDDETIRAWIVEQGGDNPHHKCSHDTLVAKADELNAALAAQKAA